MKLIAEEQMETKTLKTIPGVNTWEALRGFTRAGFLEYIGELWQQHGDVFQINIFNRRMVVAMHPDAVRHVNVANRQNYDKLQSYEVVRKFMTGNGLLTSTGDLGAASASSCLRFIRPKVCRPTVRSC